MAVQTLYYEVEAVLTKRLTNAFRTGEFVTAPDWVSDLAACLALAVTMVEGKGLAQALPTFNHQEADRFIQERWAGKTMCNLYYADL